MQGQLFTQDFLTRGVTETPLHQALTDAAFAVFRNSLKNIFKGLDGASTINEAQTEQVVINKVLAELGWADDYLPQVNSDAKGREAVPDCLLFAGSDQKAAALDSLDPGRGLRPLSGGAGQRPSRPRTVVDRYKVSRTTICKLAPQA